MSAVDDRSGQQLSPDSPSAVQAGSYAASCHARKTITVRFSEEELDRIRQVCSMPLSQFIREAALGRAEAVDLAARTREVNA